MADTIYEVTSGFYDSVGGDRLYSAEQMNMPYKKLVGDGVYANSDGSESDDFSVSEYTGMIVKVSPGNAIVGGKWAENSDDMEVEVAGNSASYARIDSIILRVNKNLSARAAGIVYRQGTAAATPAAPDLDTASGVTELRLANITVGVGVTEITAANITDTRGGTECPWVSLTMAPGAITSAGLAAGAVTEDKLAAALLKKTLNAYVTPEMYGAAGDGTTDDTGAFEDALMSGKKVLAAGSYYLTDQFFTDDSVLEGAGTYTNKIPYVSKAVKGNGPLAVSFEKAIWNEDLVSDPSSVYVNGAVYDSDSSVVVLAFGDTDNETAYIVTTDKSFNKLAEYVSSVAGHGAGGAYNARTRKVYFAPGISDGNGNAYVVGYDSSASGVTGEQQVTLTNFPQASCSAILYDYERDIYLAASDGYIYLLDNAFNYLETAPMTYSAAIMAGAVDIDNNGVVIQSMALIDGQLAHLWHSGSEDYENQHDALSYWISQYNYKTGGIKNSYCFDSIAGHDEIEALVNVDGRWYALQALRNTMTFISRVRFEESVQTSDNKAVDAALPSGTDINALIRFGTYHTRTSTMAQTMAHRPFDEAFTLCVLPNAYGDYITQIAVNVRGAVAVRVYDAYNEAWQGWNYANKAKARTFTAAENDYFTDGGTAVYRQGDLCLVKLEGALTGTDTVGWKTIGTVEDENALAIIAANLLTNAGAVCRARVSGTNLQISYGGAAANIGTQFSYIAE